MPLLKHPELVSTAPNPAEINRLKGRIAVLETHGRAPSPARDARAMRLQEQSEKITWLTAEVARLERRLEALKEKHESLAVDYSEATLELKRLLAAEKGAQNDGGSKNSD